MLHLISVHYRLENPPEDVLLRLRLGTAKAILSIICTESVQHNLIGS